MKTLLSQMTSSFTTLNILKKKLIWTKNYKNICLDLVMCEIVTWKSTIFRYLDSDHMDLTTTCPTSGTVSYSHVTSDGGCEAVKSYVSFQI